MMSKRIDLIPLEGFPIVQVGDDIPNLVVSTIHRNGISLEKGDIIVVTHSIVSIAEGKVYRLDDVNVSDKAKEIAERTGHFSKRVEIALREAEKILREEPVLITATKHGIITDFSGVDESNAPLDTLIAIPNDPDKSAKSISEALSLEVGYNIPVIITDTQGRPWRKGAVNLAIGIAGMSPFQKNEGRRDLYGYQLKGSLVCLADEIAAAAELTMGQADEGVPVVIVRGIVVDQYDGSASQVIRPDSENRFI